MNTNALNEIADLATVLAAEMPEAAENLRRELETVAECRNAESLRQFLAAARHNVSCYRQQCHELRGEMDRLADLVYLHLPEVDLNFCRRSPGWYPEDAGADWAAITAELRLVQATARRKLLTGDGDTGIGAIPPDKRTRPMTKKRAAQMLGRAGDENRAVEWLNACIDDGIIRYEYLSRQSGVYHLDDFPESCHKAIRP